MEDGEELDHVQIRAGKGGDFAPVLKDAGPVGNAVGAGEREGIAGEDFVQEFWGDDHGYRPAFWMWKIYSTFNPSVRTPLYALD